LLASGGDIFALWKHLSLARSMAVLAAPHWRAYKAGMTFLARIFCARTLRARRLIARITSPAL